jgi:hypothetical protein
MESSATAFRESLAAPPAKRPSWPWTVVATLLALLAGAITARIALWTVESLQLLPQNIVVARGVPWPATDAWSLAADAGVALLIGYACAWWLQLMVRLRTSRAWDLRLWPVACAVALATATETAGPTAASLTGLALIVVVAQAVALRPASAKRRATTATTAVVAALLLAATLSYQPLNPLLATFSGQENQLMSLSFGPQESSSRLLAFAFENGGIDTIAVHSIHPIGTNVKLLDVDRYAPAFTSDTLARGAVLQGSLRLSRASCATEAARRRIPPVTVTRVDVRVTTLGMVRTQRFDVKPAVDLYCR